MILKVRYYLKDIIKMEKEMEKEQNMIHYINQLCLMENIIKEKNGMEKDMI